MLTKVTTSYKQRIFSDVFRSVSLIQAPSVSRVPLQRVIPTLIPVSGAVITMNQACQSINPVPTTAGMAVTA